MTTYWLTITVARKDDQRRRRWPRLVTDVLTGVPLSWRRLVFTGGFWKLISLVLLESNHVFKQELKSKPSSINSINSHKTIFIIYKNTSLESTGFYMACEFGQRGGWRRRRRHTRGVNALVNLHHHHHHRLCHHLHHHHSQQQHHNTGFFR